MISYAEQRISKLKQGAAEIVLNDDREQKLQTHCLNFLVYENLKKNKSLEAQLKLSAARKRNLEKLYNGIIADITRLRNAEFDQSSDFFYNQFLIEKNLFELTTENEKKNAKVNIGASLNIDRIAFHLDIYYFLEKAKHYLQSVSSESVVSQIEFFQSMYDFYKEKDCPLLNIYLVTGLITYDEEQDSKALSVLLLDNIKSFIHHIPINDAKLIVDVLDTKTSRQHNDNIGEIHAVLKNQIKIIENENQPNLS